MHQSLTCRPGKGEGDKSTKYVVHDETDGQGAGNQKDFLPVDERF